MGYIHDLKPNAQWRLSYLKDFWIGNIKMKAEKVEEATIVDIYKRYRFVRQESDQANESQSAAQKGPKVCWMNRNF